MYIFLKLTTRSQGGTPTRGSGCGTGCSTGGCRSYRGSPDSQVAAILATGFSGAVCTGIVCLPHQADDRQFRQVLSFGGCFATEYHRLGDGPHQGDYCSAAILYETLKERLFSHFKMSEYARLEKLVTMLELGVRKPSAMPAAMLEVCPRGEENTCSSPDWFFTACQGS